MDENLIGYLLDALDSDTRQETEKYLLKNPTARLRLETLRQALEPLGADRESDDPPPDLWVRTLARVAEYRSGHLPAAPKFASDQPIHRSWWRRADVLVAASVLLCVSLMIGPVLSRIRFRRDLVACQDNLHNFYVGVKDFSDRHHGSFPDVATAVPAPWNVAGNFVPILMEEGLIGDNVSVQCPASGQMTPPQYTLQDLRNMDAEQLDSRVWSQGGGYSYSLGYKDNLGEHGPRIDPQLLSSMRPLIADRPPRDIMLGTTANSPNHGGAGQNVLFMDGHVAYCTQRVLPCAIGGFDDIYLNQDNQVHAGRTPWDTVLGDSQAHS